MPILCTELIVPFNGIPYTVHRIGTGYKVNASVWFNASVSGKPMH